MYQSNTRECQPYAKATIACKARLARIQAEIKDQLEEEGGPALIIAAKRYTAYHKHRDKKRAAVLEAG